MIAPITTTIDWQGIRLTVLHKPNWTGCGFDHIEITSRNRVPFPISETGYRSHFLHGDEIGRYGDATAYVQAWLDEAGRTSAWERIDQETRQLTLF